MEKKVSGQSDPKRRRLLLMGLLVIVLCLVGISFALQKTRLKAGSPDGDVLILSRGLDDIFIDATFYPERRVMEVFQRCALTNRGSEPRHEMVLRSYPNAFQAEETSPFATEERYEASYPGGFSSGALSVTSVAIHLGGEEPLDVFHRYLDAQKTVLQLSLPISWEPQETITVAFTYTLHIPAAAGRFGVNNDIWALGNAFLIPSPYEDGAYRSDPYYAIGDPFVSDCANYAATINVPEGYICAGSSWPYTASLGDGRMIYAFQAYVIRDFALSISPHYRAAQAMEGGVLVTVYAKNSDIAQQTLGYARKALACYSARYGAYPYPALTLTEVNFPMDGAEYSGLAMFNPERAAGDRQQLEWLVAHEVAHQWWYGVVGSDPVNQPWQDEALCAYSVLNYVETYYGWASREAMAFSRAETAMRVSIPRGVTPGSPLDFFGSVGEYTLLVQDRGAAMLLALNEALNGRLDDFLQAYYDDYRFARATRSDFEACLKAFSGEDWSPLLVDYLDTHLRN